MFVYLFHLEYLPVVAAERKVNITGAKQCYESGASCSDQQAVGGGIGCVAHLTAANGG
jgi:hypothetical protein